MSLHDLKRRRIIMVQAKQAIDQALRELDYEEIILNAQLQLQRERDLPVEPRVVWRRSPRYKDGCPVVDLTLTFEDLN